MVLSLYYLKEHFQVLADPKSDPLCYELEKTGQNATSPPKYGLDKLFAHWAMDLVSPQFI